MFKINSKSIKSSLLSLLLIFVLVVSIGVSQTKCVNAAYVPVGESGWASDVTDLWKTNAVINVAYRVPAELGSLVFTETGITLCDENGNKLKEYKHEETQARIPGDKSGGLISITNQTDYLPRIYNVNETLEYTLEPGKTYKYQAYILFKNGKEESPWYSFTTVDASVPDPIDISNMTLKLDKTKLVYTGKNLSVKASIDGLKEGEDYIIGYANSRKAVGVFQVSATGIGKYCGEVKQNIFIYPKKEAITKLTATKKGFKVKWKKDAGKRMAGYQIQYSLHSNFLDSTFVDIDDPNKISEKITELKSKKTYYVRVRSYGMYVDIQLNSAWSDVKKIKTK